MITQFWLVIFYGFVEEHGNQHVLINVSIMFTINCIKVVLVKIRNVVEGSGLQNLLKRMCGVHSFIFTLPNLNSQVFYYAV